MRKALVIGIGAGNPDYITIQAINALNQVDVFFVADKGGEKEDLIKLRREICDRFIKDRTFRVVEYEQPRRGDASKSYLTTVEQWHEAIANKVGTLLREELREGECAGFLVWGDPSLYDSTLRILAAVQARGGFELEYEVIPGITSVQALAAQHKIPLNRIGESIQITTGRRLAAGFPNNADSVVVMLDGNCSFRGVASEDVDIYWGAYLGTEDEILISGKLRDVMDDIERVRAEARARKGWVMDTYLLRRSKSDDAQ
ncbi:precorrin-6A synthase (deacetylating) [Microvirga sp. VF16]|uniref:precorrin-6A synthase (deacetylating) n=1 Tax=Microvirga sp. VF16 TaxID=2807101 RepID=UPI00193E8620|nr:precorrin-6A synthase (deacetylating) [Microvirga sp. VF16]QRM31308.1 precorrin-6A synthase (deacetylating) [Microvirga sp. VF16]